MGTDYIPQTQVPTLSIVYPCLQNHHMAPSHLFLCPTIVHVAPDPFLLSCGHHRPPRWGHPLRTKKKKSLSLKMLFSPSAIKNVFFITEHLISYCRISYCRGVIFHDKTNTHCRAALFAMVEWKVLAINEFQSPSQYGRN